MVDAASNIPDGKCDWDPAKRKKYKYQRLKVCRYRFNFIKIPKPDLSSFADPEVCFTVPLDYHAGLIDNLKKWAYLKFVNNYTDQQADFLLQWHKN
jgi:hypothetical protein